MPRVRSFFELSCSFLHEHHRSSFRNPSVGSPTEYIKSYDKMSSRVKRKKSAKKTRKVKKQRSYCYKYNELLTPCLEYSDTPLFKTDGKNAFRHKTLSDVRVSTRRQKSFRAPEVATDFYNSYPELFSGIDEFNLNNHCVVEGCFESNRHTIQAQMDLSNFCGGALPSLEDFNLIETAIKDTVRKLKIVEFPGTDITDIRNFDFDLSTKPGFRYEHYLMKQTKKECVNEAVFLAEERYAKILRCSQDGKLIRRSDILPGIYTIGARNKREDEPVPGEELISRAVHMPEFHTELHGGVFSDIITTNFVSIQEGPIFIGNSFLKSHRLEKLMNENFCAVEGDWKKFDSTLCNSLITAALSICRSYFPEGLLYDNHFLAILDSLVIKDYHMVGGSVYRILQGLPSGSKWTNLLGSIINLIALNYTFSDIKFNERSFAVGGDDFVVFLKNEVDDIDKICDIAEVKADEIGMCFKFLKRKMYKYSDDINDYPVFYKYTVFKSVPVVPLESIVERTFSPWNKKYTCNSEVLKFLQNLLPSLGHPSSGCLIFYYYYQYVFFRVTGRLLPLYSIIATHSRVFGRMYSIRSTLKEIKATYDKIHKSKRNTFITSPRNSRFLKQVFFVPI